jgi:hypothetical protein
LRSFDAQKAASAVKAEALQKMLKELVTMQPTDMAMFGSSASCLTLPSMGLS